MTIRALYSNGVLRLLEPLDLPENTEVEVVLVSSPGVANDHKRGDSVLVAAGLVYPRRVASGRPPTPAELSEAARAVPPGTPLSELIHTGREDRC